MWISADDFKQAAFTAWLGEQGAVLARPCGEHELVHYRLDGTLCIVWSRPSKRQVTFGQQSWKHHERFEAGKPLRKPEPAPLPQRPGFLLYTDAGNWADRKLGTWAGILFAEASGSVYTELAEMSGAMACPVTSSTAAEAMAVANSVHRAIRDKHLPPRACVTVVCDNTAVVRYLGSGKKHKRVKTVVAKKTKSGGVRDALAHLEVLCERYDLIFRARWVKGHQPKSNMGHDAVNNRRCDALCRKVKP